MNHQPALLLTLSLSLLLAAHRLQGEPAGETRELAPNTGMEIGAPGKPPKGWKLNSYGEIASTLNWDTKVAHRGKASLRLDSAVFRGGAAQAYVRCPAVKKGQLYTLRAWMRAEGVSAPVRLCIRDIDRPWHFYLCGQQRLTEDWQPVVVIKEADRDGKWVGIYFNFQSAGKVWVDEVSLKEGRHPVQASRQELAATKGNLIQNSGFGLGLQGWTMPEMVAVEEGGLNGGPCAHWLHKGPYMLEGRPVKLKPGQQYTFSAWLRAPNAGTSVRMGLREVGGKDTPRKSVALTAKWQPYSFSFKPTCAKNRLYFPHFSWEKGKDFCIDNVQLEEGDLTEHGPMRSVEAGFDLPRSRRFPTAGEELKVKVNFATFLGPGQALVELVTIDFYGKETIRQTLNSDRGTQEVPMSFDEPGFLTLQLREATEDGTVVHDEAQICVIPKKEADEPNDPFFGCHGTVGTHGEYHAITALAKAGCGNWRLHDLGSYAQWYKAEPEKGKFVWYDEPIKAIRDRGMNVLGVFSRTAPWAARPSDRKRNPHSRPPKDWDDLANYVYRTVDHYKGLIKHWEVWNEPWGEGFWSGTPEEYAKLLEIAYAQAKRADPDCVIVGGCFWPGKVEFTDGALAAGAAKDMDAVSYHHYVEPDAMAQGQVKRWYHHIRDKMEAAGGRHLPIWMTEGGTFCPSWYWWMGRRDSARGAAETVAKHLIETKSLGATTSFYYHAWQEIGSPRMFHWLLHNHWVLLEYDGSPKVNYAAYSGAAHQLAHARPFGAIERGHFRLHVFERGEEVIAAAWARGALLEPRNLDVRLGPEVSAANMMGASIPLAREGDAVRLALRSDPVYLRVRGLPAAEAVRRLNTAVTLAGK